MTDYRVNVLSVLGEKITRVRYNALLDTWNGRELCNGRPGNHLGITRLPTGEYVLIHGSDIIGEYDSAEIISSKLAHDLILKYNPELFKRKKFSDLKK
jgi:hypothetical protein